MTPLAKYIWLIKQLQKRSMTFEEINGKWLNFRKNSEDANIPILKRTFHNHINAIRKEYGIHIVCGSGYRYYIDDPDYEVTPKVERLSILNMMSETVSVNRSLFVEDNFQIFRDPDVATIMDAIKTKRKVKMNLGTLSIPDERFRELHVAPYQLHYMSGNWYLLGKTDEYGLMRIPLFFYLGHIQIEQTSYMLPRDYISEDYSKMMYGVTSEKIHIIIRIDSLFPEKLNIDKSPLMPFYQEVKIDSLEKNNITVEIEIPKTPFALHILKSRLGYYAYYVLNDKDPFNLFTEQQYNNEIFYPTILFANRR